MKLEYFGSVQSGQLKIINRQGFNTDLYCFEGKEVRITIEKKIKKRSNLQNAYYWPVVVKGVLRGMIDQGFERELLSEDVVHTFLKNKFLKVYVPNEDGLALQITVSTASLTTTQFMDYIADIQRWATEFLGIHLPDPDPEWREKEIITT